MTKNFTYIQKNTGDPLSATEWNNLAQDVSAAVDAINAGGAGAGSSEYVNLTSKGNVEISSPKNINIEPAGDETNNVWGDISLKPGDDIEFLSEHRPQDKQDEVSLKVHNGNKKPVKLQVNAAEFTLTTKDKEGTDANVLDVNINSGKNSKGYLKVRAQAIDLRCEDHGGIALQPKGADGQGHMNKIKFEHGGGDGLEFGTFNTEHTSLFTNDYRFNKNGVIKLATRTTVASDKADANDSTTALKYVKADDDFYDNIDNNDPTCTWSDIVEVGSRMDSVNAYYVVPVTYDEQEVLDPNGDVMVAQVLHGTFSRINGATAAINDTSFSLSEVFNLDTISATDIQNLEQTSGNTKYVRSNAINTVFGLGTNSVNPTVQQFINTFYQDGKAVFLIGSSMYCLVDSTDVCDFEFQIDDDNNRLSMSDLYTLVSHMKSNGLWTAA